MNIWNALLTKSKTSFCIMLLTLGVGEDFFTRDYVTPQDQLIRRAIENRTWIINYINAFPKENYNFKLAAGKLYFSENRDHKSEIYFNGHVPQESLIGLLQDYARPGTVAIDAGASIGTTTMALCDAVGPRGHVIAFEARPKMFSELFHNLVLNQIKNVRLYWGTLSAENGKMELSSNWTVAGCPAVAKKSLDYFRLKNVSLIKIDLDQLNLDFISGAKQTIEKCKPVILIENSGSTPNLTPLTSLNYTIHEYEPHIFVALPYDYKIN